MATLVLQVDFDMSECMIHHKGIVHNVLNDAPFIGAVVIAKACGMPCKNCINQSLKNVSEIFLQSTEDIIHEIKQNKLNEGVILSGLEWSEQPCEMEALVETALVHQLKVMIYTHHDEDAFFDIAPAMKKKPVYIKFGLYDEHLKSDHHSSYSVKLATTNQKIVFFGK